MSVEGKYVPGLMDPSLCECVVTDDTRFAVATIRSASNKTLPGVVTTPHGDPALAGGLLTLPPTPIHSVHDCPPISATYACLAALALGQAKGMLLNVFDVLKTLNEPEFYYEAVPCVSEVVGAAVLLNSLGDTEDEEMPQKSMAAYVMAAGVARRAAKLLDEVSGKVGCSGRPVGAVGIWETEAQRQIASEYVNEQEDYLVNGLASLYYSGRTAMPLLWRAGYLIQMPSQLNKDLPYFLIRHRCYQLAYDLINEMKDVISTASIDSYAYWLQGCQGKVRSLSTTLASLTTHLAFQKAITLSDPSITAILTAHHKLFSFTTILRETGWYTSDLALAARMVGPIQKEQRQYIEDLKKDAADVLELV
eukprot:TRINITY_DN34285_c0_g1_i1.p1 TRINITY_DN34285_c0_g1~~TRINITY_DN34285_c0_g1_i1.p1  ORF type:complete len:416 (+),score=94.86 TRINITY_DN34285_c0_g1_i1:158-1249(+)